MSSVPAPAICTLIMLADFVQGFDSGSLLENAICDNMCTEAGGLSSRFTGKTDAAAQATLIDDDSDLLFNLPEESSPSRHPIWSARAPRAPNQSETAAEIVIEVDEVVSTLLGNMMAAIRTLPAVTQTKTNRWSGKVSRAEMCTTWHL